MTRVIRNYSLFAGLLAAALGLSVLWLPSPLSIEAPAVAFSAGRAFVHVRELAQKPHPAGSAENRRVRAYIVSTLSFLGLTPRELNTKRSGIELDNVYAEIPGTRHARPSLLLVSHYDSVSAGPGAGDCASGVATILETVRALQSGAPASNTIAVLITDGEEGHMTGAASFVEEHPELWRDLPAVLNLDARGSRGPVMMYETGPHDAGLVSLFARVCPFPIAVSFSEDVYHHMDNDTDFSEFRRVGLHGWNFAFVGGLECYHTALDTPANLSLRTLQHEGSCVLSLVWAVAKADEPVFRHLAEPGDATCFPLCRGVLAHYPAWMASPLALLTVAVFLIALWRQRRALRLLRVLGGLGLSIGACLLSVAVGVLALMALARAFKTAGFGPYVMGLPFDPGWQVLLLAAAGTGAWWSTRKLLRTVTPAEHLAGAIIPWLALTVFAMRVAPGAGYLFAWPALLAAVALAFSTEAGLWSWDGPIYAALTAAPAILLLTPTICVLHQALTIGVAPVSMGMVALACSLFPVKGSGKNDNKEFNDKAESPQNLIRPSRLTR